MSLSKILPIVLFSIAILLSYILIPTITIRNSVKRTFNILIFFALFIGNFLNPYPEDYSSEFSMFIASNKLSFFAHSVNNYRKQKANLEDNLNQPIAINEDHLVAGANHHRAG